MALIAMAVFDTVENQRTSLTEKTVKCILDTVDLTKHRLIISDNGSCEDTLYFYEELAEKYVDYFNDALSPFPNRIQIIRNKENLGTAKAINLAWKQRLPNENAIKMDNDVVIHHNNWVDEMEAAIARDPKIGQCGLKRKDCWESPSTDNEFYHSELHMLSHKPGESWIVVEQVNHVMGTCVMHSSALLDKLGYLYQPKLYGFDDSLMSARSILAGFKNVFLPHINIDHIDPGDTPYQKWKEKHASSQWIEYHETLAGFQNGNIPLYYNPFKNEQ